MPQFPRAFPRVHPLSASVGAPFGGGARPFEGFRPFSPPPPPPRPVIFSEMPEYADGYRLGTEDVRRASYGSVVYMPNWIRTAGEAYSVGYSVGVSDARGRLVAEGPLRIRVFPPALSGLLVDTAPDFEKGVRAGAVDDMQASLRGPRRSPDFRPASNDFRWGYSMAVSCFAPEAPVEGRFLVLPRGLILCGLGGTPRRRMHDLYPDVPLTGRESVASKIMNLYPVAGFYEPF